MAEITNLRTAFTVRPHDEQIGFENSVSRYYRHAHVLLPLLEAKHAEVASFWPVSADMPIVNSHIEHVNLRALTDERNHLSDSVRIYAAMAAEGFLNLYGVLRLGQEVFDSEFERLGLIPKATLLLLVCDGLKLSKKDPMLLALDQVAQSRNALVHPKSREFANYSELKPKAHSRTPQTARDAVKNMDKFFTEFLLAVPDAKHVVPTIKSAC